MRLAVLAVSSYADPEEPVPRADCCAKVCAYRPTRIGKILRLLDEMAQSGYEPSEALMGALLREELPETINGEEPYENRSGHFGPSDPSGAQIVTDIWRAIRAGKRDPRSISAYLCPDRVDDDDTGSP